jgi:hypothetical protein
MSWQDTARPLPERVEALLAEMTLAEKVGQLGSRWPARGRVQLTGPARVVGASRQLVTPVDCRFVARA